MITIAKQVNYKVLDYIESTGMQYIDTNIKPTNTIKTDFKYMYKPASTGNAFAFVYGSRTSVSSNDIHSFYDNTGLFYCGFGSANTSVNNNHNFNVVQTVQNGADGCYFNGTRLTTYSAYTFTSKLNMYLFGCNQNGQLDSRTLTGRIYYFKIFDNGILVRDFVPVKTDLNEICLFDKVTKQCFKNQGTGSFVAGSETGETITSAIVSIKNMYVGRGTAKKIKKVYFGVGGKSRLLFPPVIPKTTISFTTCPFPTAWTRGADYDNYSATDSYGSWALYGEQGSTSNNISKAFDRSTSTYMQSNSLSSGSTNSIVEIRLPEGVSICPSEIFVAYGRGTNMYIQGYNADTSSWEDLYTLPSTTATTTATQKTQAITTTTYYTRFRYIGNRYSGNSKYTYLHELQVTKGAIKY